MRLADQSMSDQCGAMKRLLVAARANPEAWAALFRKELPDHEILTATPTDAAPVAYVVVGRPEAGLIRSLPGLEVVLSLNAGVEHLLASGEVPQHIPIVRMVDDGLTEGMVDWVMAQALAWHRNLFEYHAEQRERRWAPRPEKLARERIVLVLGAGALGLPVLAMLKAFGFRTRVWSRTLHVIPGVEAFAGAEGLEGALAGVDILINLLPLTAETENLLDRKAFARLAPGAFLINGGRGGAIVDADLLSALDEGVLGGAALDVFRQEPLSIDHPFWTHPGVRLSPHVAAPTHPHTAVSAMAETVRRHERGEPLLHLVDRQRGY
jgi:glyoxylate/hydroxypyruvate reductase A